MHNQNYIKNVVTLQYESSKCIGCKMCVEVCPHNVFKMIGKKAEIINKDNCIECGACEINCITHALTVNQGVGCASAVIWGFFKGKEPSCDCDTVSTCC